MEQALRNRRTAYASGLAFVAVAVAISFLTAPVAAKASRPDVLMVVFLVYALASIAVWYAVFLRPEQAIGMADRQSQNPSLSRMAWQLSLMGVAGMIGPVVLGVILYQMSGQAWRMALLASVGLAGGAILYGRVGEDIRRLHEHGLIGWDPFGPQVG
jgi:archaellum biogenesis protein FlaJ (TadC family)